MFILPRTACGTIAAICNPFAFESTQKLFVADRRHTPEQILPDLMIPIEYQMVIDSIYEARNLYFNVRCDQDAVQLHRSILGDDIVTNQHIHIDSPVVIVLSNSMCKSDFYYYFSFSFVRLKMSFHRQERFNGTTARTENRQFEEDIVLLAAR